MTYDDINIVHAAELLALVCLKEDRVGHRGDGVVAEVMVSRKTIHGFQSPMKCLGYNPPWKDEILVNTTVGLVKFIARKENE